mmetsp:Transcript_1865/g.5824  ORF Transcript_1865/g.5824 Transcript_1865/m.5824 type:complete len:353 (-) Transcript_1865:97-1155(-)
MPSSSTRRDTRAAATLYRARPMTALLTAERATASASVNAAAAVAISLSIALSLRGEHSNSSLKQSCAGPFKHSKTAAVPWEKTEARDCQRAWAAEPAMKTASRASVKRGVKIEVAIASSSSAAAMASCSCSAAKAHSVDDRAPPPTPRSCRVTASEFGRSWASAALSSGVDEPERRFRRHRCLPVARVAMSDQIAPSVARVIPPRTAVARAAKMGSLLTVETPATAMNGLNAASHSASSSARCPEDRHSCSLRSYSAASAWNRSTASSESFESGWRRAARTRKRRRNVSSSVPTGIVFHSISSLDGSLLTSFTPAASLAIGELARWAWGGEMWMQPEEGRRRGVRVSSVIHM